MLIPGTFVRCADQHPEVVKEQVYYAYLNMFRADQIDVFGSSLKTEFGDILVNYIISDGIVDIIGYIVQAKGKNVNFNN